MASNTLVTTAIIRAHDGLTGPLKKMAASAHAADAQFRHFGSNVLGHGDKIVGALQKVDRASQRLIATGRRMTTGSVVGGFMMGGALSEYRDFERKILGTGMAAIPDAMAEGKDALAEGRKAMDEARVAALKLSKSLAIVPKVAADITEAVAKGGGGSLTGSLAELTAKILKTDPGAEVNGIVDALVSAQQIYRKEMERSKSSPLAISERVADAMYIGAAATTLSTGSYNEALNKFAPLGASVGLSPEQNSAMLAAAKKSSGQNPIELAETHKSVIMRNLVPTAKNLEAMDRLQLNRAKYFKGGTGTFSSADVVSRLATISQGVIRGKNRAELLREIEKAKSKKIMVDDGQGGQEESLLIHDAEWQAKMQERLAGIMGLDYSKVENRDRVRTMWDNALTSSAGTFDMEAFLKDYAEAYAKDPGSAAAAIEKRRAALLGGIAGAHTKGADGKSEYDRMIERIQKGRGALNTANLLDLQSPEGRLRSFTAAWERFKNAIMSSKIVQTMMNLITDGIAKLDQLGSGAINAIATALIGLAAVGPIAWIGGNILRIATAVAGLSRALMTGSVASSAMNAAMLASPLFSTKAQGKLNSKAAAAASARMIGGMGLSAQRSQNMILGMSAASNAIPAVVARVGGLRGALALARGGIARFGVQGAIAAGTLWLLENNIDSVKKAASSFGEGFGKAWDEQFKDKKAADGTVIEGAATRMKKSLQGLSDEVRSMLPDILPSMEQLKAAFHWNPDLTFWEWLGGESARLAAAGLDVLTAGINSLTAGLKELKTVMPDLSGITDWWKNSPVNKPTNRGDALRPWGVPDAANDNLGGVIDPRAYNEDAWNKVEPMSSRDTMQSVSIIGTPSFTLVGAVPVQGQLNATIKVEGPGIVTQQSSSLKGGNADANSPRVQNGPMGR